MTPAEPRIAVLRAPAAWRVIDFISDLHLQAAEPANFVAWQRYMASTSADALFILGDLFEVWVGDDIADSAGFEQECGHVLAAAARRCDLFFMPGNRDFLVGDVFLAACQTRPLEDPTLLEFAGQRWLLSHGDALCLDDTEYQQFRVQVRSPDWQQSFLAKPLAERQVIARSLRAQSEARKLGSQPSDYADVDTRAARRWLQATQATTLIHGHTHRPAEHDLGRVSLAADGAPAGKEVHLRRAVLSDWDVAATPPRAQVLRASARGLQRIDLCAC